MTRLLFLCTGNSCRSQMAEGWARSLKGDQIDAYSAGIQTHGLNPYAVKAMAEAGVDITSQQSQTVSDIADAGGPTEFDIVVTVCGHADENCPVFAGAPKIVHVPFDDPPKLAAEIEGEEEKMAPYRRVRDEIRAFVAGLPASLETPAAN
ncbi:MAG: arsenate reductase ArsC [Planctomycetota bacterium]